MEVGRNSIAMFDRDEMERGRREKAAGNIY